MHSFFSLRRMAALILSLMGFAAHVCADEIVSFLESRNGQLNIGTYQYWFNVSSPQILRFRLEALSGTSNITISRRRPDTGVDELIFFARYGGSYGSLGDKGYREFNLQAGDHTIRLNSSITSGWIRMTEITLENPPPANQAPSIEWQEAPSSATVGQTYRISACAHDPDGNLTQVNVWKNGQPFAFAGGGNGTDGDSGNSTSDNTPSTVTFTAQAVDSAGLSSAVISHAITIDTPPNAAPTIAWGAVPAVVDSGQRYTISARATDPDGNLRTIHIWKDGGAFASTEGGNGSTSEASNQSADTGPRTVTYIARATDASGATSPTLTHTVTVEAPVPVQFSLVTSAGTGGTVSPGGLFMEGSSISVTATPDALHDFVGWSGDASGTNNPIAILMNRNRAVHALFALKSYSLVTSAIGSGIVTMGGTYPHGSIVTISATPAPNARFAGWAGDATGMVPTVVIVMDAPKLVQAVFADKQAQTISFSALADVSVGAAPFSLNAVASSGLPVYYGVSGPAMIMGNQLQVIAPGVVSVEARQDGNDFYLPALPVVRTFNVVAPAVLKYRAPNRTLLQSETNRGLVPFVIEQP
ncbi:hypothetical protein OH491_26780 [Termitidicoccus mucosus]|uniref:Bacterial repeat domain-containing protein n=1 Tax=Termitidicoccus mucosus TaxID=1184151 RepID=A0A178IE16_9BACT|nr:hypothetical protein AW736_23990 [Opitutaceae bacterium TSB47]